MKIDSKIIEYTFLAILLALLLYAGPANFLDRRISHEFPYSLAASDAFMGITYSEFVKESGSFRHYPPWISFGYKDHLACNPPMLYTIPALMSGLSGLEVYDSIILFTYITTIIACFLMYLIIRKHSVTLAILSSPLFLFLFFRTSAIAYTWGIWTAIVGSFSMMVCLFALQNIDLPHSEYLIGLGFIGTIIANAAYFIFILLFIVGYNILYIIKHRRIRKGIIRKIVVPLIIALVLTSYYMVIFKNSRFSTEMQGFSLKSVSPSDIQGSRWVLFSELGPSLYVAALGIVLSLVLLKLKPEDDTLLMLIAIGLFLITIMVGNYFLGFGIRSLKARFHMGIYLSLFFGLPFYFALSIFKKQKSRVISALIALALCLILVNAYFIPSSYQGMMNPYYWEAFRWVQDNTPKDAKVYLFYSDAINQGGFNLNTHRVNLLVDINDLIEQLRKNELTSTIKVTPQYESACGLTHTTGFMSFEHYDIPEDLSNPLDLCDIEYYFIPLHPQLNSIRAIGDYNSMMRQRLLDKAYITEVFNNQVISILHNEAPGGDCLDG